MFEHHYLVQCIAYEERMNPIDFQGQQSKVKVMRKYGNNLMNMVESKDPNSVYFDKT